MYLPRVRGKGKRVYLAAGHTLVGLGRTALEDLVERTVYLAPVVGRIGRVAPVGHTERRLAAVGGIGGWPVAACPLAVLHKVAGQDKVQVQEGDCCCTVEVVRRYTT